MAGEVEHRARHLGEQLVPPRHEWPEEPRVRAAIVTEAARGLVDGPVQDRGGAVVQRVRERHIRVDPLEAVLL